VSQISVVIPARNAEATLGRTLAALARQVFDGEFETIVVDNASKDATAAVAEEAGARVVRRAVDGGPAAARNSGVAEARSGLLAFTDADCEPTPGWVAAMFESLQHHELVTGPVEPDPSADAGPFDRTLRVSGPSLLFETANLGVTRRVFDAVGGFEAFIKTSGPGLRPGLDEGPFGEDVVFGWRASHDGASSVFAAEALVHHAVFRRTARGYVAERWRMRFFPALLRDVPQMRQALILRVFLSRRTALFDLAVAGVVGAAASRRRWPLLAALPYARRYLPLSSGPRALASRGALAGLSGDALGALALVWGSIASRRLLL
jgi:glycosyltransferase involved in cell wall biosynthesis